MSRTRRKSAVFRVVADWEERLSLFLQDAIQSPDQEARICEELIEYVQYLVRMDRTAYRRLCLDVVLRAFEQERSKFKPRVLRGLAEGRDR